jgi:small-conductance mechanosensitive channel
MTLSVLTAWLVPHGALSDPPRSPRLLKHLLRLSLLRLFWALPLLLACALPAAHAESPQGPAPLVVHNREIFVFRATLTGYTPRERAEAAGERLDSALERGAGPGVTSVPIEDMRLVKLGEVGIFFIAPGDLGPGETLDAAAARAEQTLTRVLAETREARDLTAILHATLAVAIATALLVVLVWLLVRAARWLGSRAHNLARAAAERVRVGGYTALSPDSVGALARNGVRLAAWAIGLFLGYLWLAFALRRFPYTRPWAETLLDFLLHVLGTVTNGVVAAIPGLVFVVVIFVITRAVAQSLSVFLRRVETGRVTVGWLDTDTAAPTRRIVLVLLWLFALAMAYPYLPGANSDAFKGLSVLVGLMISIGASGIVGQAAGGLMITYTHTLRLGEFVRIGDTEGTVTDLGIFATRIRTGMGEEVTLPNAYVVANTIKNYSRVATAIPGFALSTQVTIGYSTPWRQVQAMLLQAAQRTPGLLAEPKAFVVQTALSDFYVEYRLVCYAGPEAPKQRALAMDALHANIQDVFNEHGVQIMSPHYMTDPAQPQVVPKEKWYEPPAQPPGKQQG